MITPADRRRALSRLVNRLWLPTLAAMGILSAGGARGQAPASSGPAGGTAVQPGAPSPAPINPGVPWPATDALGRSLPLAGEGSDAVPAPRADRFVGIFYFLTLGEHVPGPYDITKIFAADPDAMSKPDAPYWQPRGPYFWGEPLLGYYNTRDPWVLRRHANLLADAGVDTLIFDTTNRVTYPDTYLKLCEVFDQVRKDGGRTPQLCFMVNTKAGETADDLYNTLYKPGLYRDLWFIWQGRPLMICDPKEASPEVKAFFTLRKAHWPFTQVNTPYAWHWEAAYPQVYGYTDDPAKPEQVNVSVAQNLRASDGKVTDMSRGDARGRSFHDGAWDKTPGAINWGLDFAEQWKRAYELDPPFVMVTGWNEWTAGRWKRDPARPIVFVDQFDQEFSRDAEPMRGGHGDNYYYQMVAGIRRYKGIAPLPTASAPKTIDLAGGFGQWGDVAPEFADHAGDTVHRDFIGVGELRYADATGRNDLVAMKVARDAKQVAFHARTRAPLTPRTDPAWMWLLIDADRDPKTGWEGFDFIVNRTVEPDGSTWVEKNTGGWQWEKVAPVKIAVQGNELMLSVPRAALGLAAGPLAFDFKWADNVQKPGDVMDFYVSGDAAPDGRFKFRYSAD
ncbi:MAG: hypothetical protein M1457_05180 [bacterium]|nr:hypothetical protein [bacterium]